MFWSTMSSRLVVERSLQILIWELRFWELRIEMYEFWFGSWDLAMLNLSVSLLAALCSPACGWQVLWCRWFSIQFISFFEKSLELTLWLLAVNGKRPAENELDCHGNSIASQWQVYFYHFDPRKNSAFLDCWKYLRSLLKTKK